MRLKRYAVTVLDNWTPTRTFWTLSGARQFYLYHERFANVFQWADGEWQWMFGDEDLSRT